jgi:hypothetical protein
VESVVYLGKTAATIAMVEIKPRLPVPFQMFSKEWLEEETTYLGYRTEPFKVLRIRMPKW